MAKQLSRLSDSEVLDAYEANSNNATKTALHLGCGATTLRDRLRLIKDVEYQKAKSKEEGSGFFWDELEARGIDPRTVKITKARINTGKKNWSMGSKDEDGNVTVTPLTGDDRSVVIDITPACLEGPKWPVIEQGPALNIMYTTKVQSVSSAKIKIFVWPDTQIGYYRNIETMELTPFHDIAAINVGLEALRLYQPNEVVINGDFIDMATHSKYLQVAEFQLTFQPSINFATKLIGKIRSIVGPKCKIVFVPGNHERRASEYCALNAKANYGIKRGTFENELPDTWPVQSIPFLLRLEQANVEYMHEYPGGEYWVNPSIIFTHQPEKNQDLRATLIHGHNESGEMKSHSVHTKDGIKVYRRYCIPGFGRQDNTQDKTNLNSTSVPSNRAKKSGNQAFGTIDIVNEDVFQVIIHDIINGECVFYGQHLTQAKGKK